MNLDIETPLVVLAKKTCTHKYRCIYATCKHIRSTCIHNVCTNAHKQAYKQIQSHIYTHMHAHAWANTCVDTHKCKSNADMHATCTDTCTSTHANIWIQTCIDVKIHTNMKIMIWVSSIHINYSFAHIIFPHENKRNTCQLVLPAPVVKSSLPTIKSDVNHIT